MTKQRHNMPNVAINGPEKTFGHGNRNPVDVVLPAYEDLYNKIYRDDLTGLLNRRGFVQELERLRDERAKEEPDGIIAVGIIDVDRFKEVNDLHGHEEGDKTLKEVADIISSCLREGDIVARWGGDEFAISMLLHHNFDSTTHANVAKGFDLEIKKRLEEVIKTGDSEPLRLIGFSLGMEICRLSELGKLDKIIDMADSRMYEKKRKSVVPIPDRRAVKAGKAAMGASKHDNNTAPLSDSASRHN